MDLIRHHLKGKTHIIWDWNGTLLDDVQLCHRIIAEIMADHGVEPVCIDTYRRTFRFPVVEYYKEIGFNLDQHCFKELSRKFFTSYNSHVRNCRLFDDVTGLLAALRGQGIGCSVLSAAKEDDLRDQLGHFGILPHFDHVYGLGDHFAHSKVDRGHQLLDTLGHTREQLVMFGDTDHDIEVARALGIDVVIIADGHQHPERLATRHDAVYTRTSQGIRPVRQNQPSDAIGKID